MSMCVGSEKGKLYRGDYGPAQFYKGDAKIAGYTDAEKVGTAISGVDTYNDQLNLTIDGKSEQTVTALGKNLLNCTRRKDRPDTPSTWNPATGTLLVNGKWFTSVLITLEPDTDYYFSAIRKGGTGGGSGAVSVYVATGIAVGDQVRALGAANSSFHTRPSVTEYQILLYASDGTHGECTFRNSSISKGTQPIPYEPFVPNSPSPDYPSPIRSSETFDVVSCGGDRSTATTAHVIDPLRSVGDVHDTIEVSGGKVEVVRRVVRLTARDLTSFDIYAYPIHAEYTHFRCYVGGMPNDKVLCNILPYIIYSWNRKVNCISCSAHIIYPTFANVTLGISDADTDKQKVTKLKSWLTTHDMYVDIIPDIPTITEITTTPLGQALLALRTQPHYTQVYTNATIPPTLRVKIKEML